MVIHRLSHRAQIESVYLFSSAPICDMVVDWGFLLLWAGLPPPLDGDPFDCTGLRDVDRGFPEDPPNLIRKQKWKKKK